MPKPTPPPTAPRAKLYLAARCPRITSTSKATATRDLIDLLAKGLLRVEGVGKATRYAVNVPGWHQPAIKP